MKMFIHTGREADALYAQLSSLRCDDRAGCDLALHGHAHRGSERGVTPGGTPVRNVAMPVIRAAHNTYEFAVGSADRVGAARI